MLVQSLTTFATPAPSDVPELRSNTALLMSFEGSLADGHGAVSAATRFSLMRLFRALGGAVAVFCVGGGAAVFGVRCITTDVV